LRILVLAPGFPTHDGPYVPGIVDTLAELARRHRVVVRAVRPPPEPSVEATYRGIEVWGAGRRSRLGRGLHLFRAAARDPAPDVIWAIWPDRTGLLAGALGRALRRPVLISLMGGELADLPALDYGALRSRRRRAALRLALDAAAALTVPSRPMEALLDRFDRSLVARARLLPLGVPEQAVPPRGARRSSGALRLLAVSDSSLVKRTPMLLEVLERMAARGHDATLDLFGLGEPAPWLAEAGRRGLAPRVRHLGFVRPELLRGRYAGYDALLHASAHESEGLALIEAALAGIGIACFPVGVAEELAELGAPVVLAPQGGGAERLADAALVARERTSAEGARERIAARFGVAAAAERFERLLAALAGDTR
jgi:glycosyltransferase involved in cell wall biosynthesis